MNDDNISTEPIDNPPAGPSDPARGQRLINALQVRMLELDLHAAVLASRLGYTEKYFNIILRGERWIGNVGHDKLQRIAEFLEVPPVAVYVMADILRPQDFYDPRTLAGQLEETYKLLRQDKVFLTYTPDKSTWESAPEPVRLLVSVLYAQISMDRVQAVGEPQGVDQQA